MLSLKGAQLHKVMVVCFLTYQMDQFSLVRPDCSVFKLVREKTQKPENIWEG